MRWDDGERMQRTLGSKNVDKIGVACDTQLWLGWCVWEEWSELPIQKAWLRMCHVDRGTWYLCFPASPPREGTKRERRQVFGQKQNYRRGRLDSRVFQFSTLRCGSNLSLTSLWSTEGDQWCQGTGNGEMGKCSQGKNIGFICREPEAGGFCAPASYKTSLSGRARDSLLTEFPSFPLTQIPANMIFTLLCEVTRHWERTRTWLSPSSVVVCMTLNKLPTLLRIWSIKWEQSTVIPVSEPPVGIKKRLSPENLEIQPPWPEDIYNWLLLYTALCRSHMVAAFDPSNPKGIRIQWLFPLTNF